MNSNFYETFDTPGKGTYICAGCGKERVHIIDFDTKLPVCPRCNSNLWVKKDQTI